MPEEQTERDEFDDLDEDEADEAGDAGRPWPASGYPPPGFPPAPEGWPPGGGRGARRGLLLTVIALVAAGTAYGVATVAIRDVSGGPSASSAPSASAPATGGSGLGEPAGGQGAVPSLPAGATMHLEIGGTVAAVSATSITLRGGGQTVTAAITRATTVTGKVTSIGGVKVGDLVSASLTGASGKLTADSIQDPASLPSGPGQ